MQAVQSKTEQEKLDDSLLASDGTCADRGSAKCIVSDGRRDWTAVEIENLVDLWETAAVSTIERHSGSGIVAICKYSKEA